MILSQWDFNLHRRRSEGTKAVICFRTTMVFYFKHVVGIVITCLVTISLCTGAYQSVTTQFTEGKKVSSSYTTLHKISKVQCVERCNKEKQTNGCTLAGYNKAMRSCYLSVDGPQDVLDTTDEMYGVFFYEPDQTGNNQILLQSRKDLKWSTMTECMASKLFLTMITVVLINCTLVQNKY